MGTRYNEASRPQLRISEPSPVQDVFATGVLDVENYGDYVRVTHVLDRPDPESGGELVRNIVSRVIYPTRGFASAVRTILGTLRCPHCGGGIQAGVRVGNGGGDHGRLPSA